MLKYSSCRRKPNNIIFSLCNLSMQTIPNKFLIASECTWLNIFYPGVKSLLLLPFSVSRHGSIKMKCIFLIEYKCEISEYKNGQNNWYAATIYRLIHFVKYSHPCSWDHLFQWKSTNWWSWWWGYRCRSIYPIDYTTIRPYQLSFDICVCRKRCGINGSHCTLVCS